jgi:hypothetical protein
VADTRKTTSEVIDETTDAGREGMRAAASATQDAIGTGLDGIQRVTDQFTRAFSPAGENGEALARQMSDNLGALAETGTIVVRGIQDVSREWLSLSQDRLQKNIEGLTQLARCRSVPDFVAVQSELVRDNWQLMFEGTRQIAERSMQVTNEAVQKISSETKQAADRTRKAA